MSQRTVETIAPDWAERVLAFWFKELAPKDWFVRSQAVDATIVDRFAEVYETVARTPVAELAADVDVARAAIIVLDQFPRNMFRDDPRAFETDAQALELAKALVARGDERDLSGNERAFVYLPYEHSEALADQDASVALFKALGNADYLDYAIKHRDVVARFGRFPHRNDVLGRVSTPEELAFLADVGRGF